MGQRIPETPPELDSPHIIERPDGYYWQAPDSGEEFGPFKSYAAALEDMESGVEIDFESDETLEEAEAEIGVSGWIDPDTGDLGESWTPRIEDH